MILEEDEYDGTSDEYTDASGSSEEPSSGEEDEQTNVPPERDVDFDRLVKGIRDRSDENALAKEWDFNIEDKEAEFRDDLRAASGVGKRRKKGRQQGPVLSPEVKALLGDGNQAYIDNNIPEAIRIMFEVIRIEPRAVQSWTVLAQCFEDQQNPGKALQLRIMAAHLHHDTDEWYRLAHESKDKGYNQQALYCYRKAHNLDPNNIDALWERAVLAKEINDLRNAKIAYRAILKRFPHDLSILSELRSILIELGDFPTCASIFQEAFEHYRQAYPSGRGPAPSSTEEVPGGGFGMIEILVLADLYNTVNEYESAIDTIRKGCRWLQGRGDQRYWDLCEDDREYDPPVVDIPRRTNSGGVEPGRYFMDVNARHRLAIARIKMGDTEEGQLHASMILNEDVLDYAPLFVEIADAYFERNLCAEAKPIYELLGSDANTSSVYVLMQTASCLRYLNEVKEAIDVYEHIRLVDQMNNDAKMQLAELYEVIGETRKALTLVYEVIDSRKKGPRKKNAAGDSDANPGGSLFAEDKPAGKVKQKPQNRLSPMQLRQLETEREAEMVREHRRLKELWPAMAEGNEAAYNEWMLKAHQMIETFRETRNLFMTGKHAQYRGMHPGKKPKRKPVDQEADEDRMAARLHLEMENENQKRREKTEKNQNGHVDNFRNVKFADWLRIILTYAFNHTKHGNFKDAKDVLQHMLLSSGFQQRQMQDVLRLGIISCAIHAQDFAVVVEQCRKFINVHQFNNEPLRLLIASLASGLLPTDAYITSTLQKHLFRETKLADSAVQAPDSLKYNINSRRYAAIATVKQDDDDDADVDNLAVGLEREKYHIAPPLPNKPNPITVAVYGQVCVAAKSYQSALFYLLHAYDYCPQDPMVCLSLAIASIGRAMQRQADNRHFLVAQAMAFLTKYRALRSVDPLRLEEVEFNFARTFHQLGLLTYAVKHYEKTLDIAEKNGMGRDLNNSCAKEAAYNLSLIYMSTGATPLVEALYTKWLSL
ncbi:TPR-like protein [Cylindrobasidium torrendii FP15055 ss-10]|uniref:TPR-like protein n=1 Tax=Cylindrobasidium torrendii FP15055 ss-10 TaxID=1314674 RepID=A0A0D7AWH8_9AGAR|nr:TPR-like protein [Cylindrobasidium torrendii FP15055 ss-10]